MNKNHLSIVKRSAAHLLAAAVSEYFPGSKIINGGSTDTGFYFDFIFKEKMTSFQLISIEEKMRLLSGVKAEIKTLKMTPKNAIDYLLHKGLKERWLMGKIQSALTPIVGIIEINNYLNIAAEECEFLKDAGEIKYFKLYGYEYIDVKEDENGSTEGVTRIFGALFDDPQELKNYLKLQKKYAEFDHLAYGEEMKMFFPLDGRYSINYVWNEKGVALKNKIASFLKTSLKKEGFIQLKLPDIPPTDYNSADFKDFDGDKSILKNSINKIIERAFSQRDLPFYAFEEKCIYAPVNDLFFGLYRCFKKNIINEYILCNEQSLLGEVISSLKFILKILKIYGFNSYAIICRSLAKKGRRSSLGTKEASVLEEALKACDLPYAAEKGSIGKDAISIEFLLEDGQKWMHSGPCLKIELFSSGAPGKIFLISRCSSGTIDDLVALLLENQEGSLPFWINAEQVRIICLDHCLDYAKEIKALCEEGNISAFVEDSKEPLKSRVHAAVKEKASFIAVVGEKEVKSRYVAVRKIGETEMEQMTIDSFIKKLQDIQKRKEQEV